MQRTAKRWLLLVVLAMTASGATGCLPTDLPAFLSGWFLRDLVMQISPDTLTCYRNGAPIDCGEVPTELLPSGG